LPNSVNRVSLWQMHIQSKQITQRSIQTVKITKPSRNKKKLKPFVNYAQRPIISTEQEISIAKSEPY